jgi:hypothetical protein
MKNKIAILAVLVFLFGTGLHAQDATGIKLSPQRLLPKAVRNALAAPEGAVLITLSPANQSSGISWSDALMPDGAQAVTMSGPFLMQGGNCVDQSTQQSVSIYNCYFYSMEVDLGLTDCLASNAICYYDENWNLADAYPVNCLSYCMN